MPQVRKKKKAAPRKAARKTAKKKAPRSARRKRSFFERVYDRMRDYTLAGTAGAVVIMIGIGAILWSGGYFGLAARHIDQAAGKAVASAGFDIRRVTLLGRRDTANNELEGAIGPIIGDSILHLDLDALRARVEQLGWVRSAAVTRLWPNTVHVSIREREPAAVWQIAGDLYLIDNDGAIIRETGAYEYSSLPLIVGAGAPDAAADIIKALQAQPELEALTAALVRVSERRWNMRLHNKTDIKLPETGFADALEALSIMHASQQTLDQRFEYIDLRDPERVIVRPRKDATALAGE